MTISLAELYFFYQRGFGCFVPDLFGYEKENHDNFTRYKQRRIVFFNEIFQQDATLGYVAAF